MKKKYQSLASYNISCFLNLKVIQILIIKGQFSNCHMSFIFYYNNRIKKERYNKNTISAYCMYHFRSECYFMMASARGCCIRYSFGHPISN